jgi:6-phosphogluconolactonase
MLEVVVRPDAEAVALAGRARFVAAVEAALATRGRAMVALAGGSTPRRMHELLVDAPLDWSRVEAWFGDERCVPPDHADSNHGAAWRALLSKVPIPLANIHRLRGELDPPLAAALAEAELLRVAGPAPVRFDLVCAGMGSDGHTLSLFPGTSALREERRLVVANEVPRLSTTRLTFAYPLVHAARAVLFLACGTDKRPMVRAATVVEPEVDAPPAAHARSRDGCTTWVVDAAAAP